jgi:hypothetical protein
MSHKSPKFISYFAGATYSHVHKINIDGFSSSGLFSSPKLLHKETRS